MTEYSQFIRETQAKWAAELAERRRLGQDKVPFVHVPSYDAVVPIQDAYEALCEEPGGDPRDIRDFNNGHLVHAAGCAIRRIDGATARMWV